MLRIISKTPNFTNIKRFKEAKDSEMVSGIEVINSNKIVDIK